MIQIRDKWMIIICLSTSLLAIGYFFLITFQKEETIIETQNQIWTVLPDTMIVDGDLVKAEVTKKHKKYLLRYKIPTKEQKEDILSYSRPIKIVTQQEKITPQVKRNLNGFDYQNYLKTKQIVGVYNVKKIISMEEKSLSIFRPMEVIAVARHNIHSYINKTFHSQTAFYMNSLLLGINEGDQREVWNKLSLSHLFALSGLHVAFFIELLRFILLRIGITREKTAIVESIAILIFMGLTGYSIGVIRAGIYHMIKQMNHYINGGFSRLDCWSITLLIHSLFYPTVLLSIGGQLSYYLSFLILFIQPVIHKEKRVYQLCLFQCLLSFFSLPLLCFYFYEINVLSSLFSMIFTPILFQLLMPLLVIVLLLSSVLPAFLILFVEKIVSIIHNIASGLQNLQSVQLTIGTFSLGILFSVIILQLLSFMYFEKVKKIAVSQFILLLMTPYVLLSIKYLNPFGMIAFVDVGQGDAIFIQKPFHRGNYLIDTGGALEFKKDEWKIRQSKKSNADYTLIPFLKSKGVSTLDGVFLTHAHEDHFGDINRLSEEIKIKRVFVTPGTYQEEKIKDKLKQSHINNVTQIDARNKLNIPGLDMTILHPTEIGDGQNNDSLVIKLMIHQKTFLLMGDLEKEGEDKLVQQYGDKLSADCIKIGHHGSKTSSQLSFLEIASPSEAIISAGENNRFNHPSPETITTLKQQQVNIYRTDEQGMIYQQWLPFKKELLKIKSVK